MEEITWRRQHEIGTTDSDGAGIRVAVTCASERNTRCSRASCRGRTTSTLVAGTTHPRVGVYSPRKHSNQDKCVLVGSF